MDQILKRKRLNKVRDESFSKSSDSNQNKNLYELEESVPNLTLWLLLNDPKIFGTGILANFKWYSMIFVGVVLNCFTSAFLYGFVENIYENVKNAQIVINAKSGNENFKQEYLFNLTESGSNSLLGNKSGVLDIENMNFSDIDLVDEM